MLDLLVVVDDLDDGRRAAEVVARRTKMRFLEFADPQEALAGLLELDEPFVLVLDHNFENDEWPGYRLANELREKHTYGLLLPILYLSGYMTGFEFVELLQSKLAYAPTAFLSKADGGRLLPTVRRITESFDRLEEVAREQAMAQAYAALLEVGQ